MAATDSVPSGSKRLILGVFLLVICYFALFWRLDGAYLWRDEATTANWARTMVKNHSLVPLVFDGKTVAVQGFDAHDFNEHLTPGMQGWLQFYVTAISFQLFGVSTFTARLPFAICGLMSVGVMFLIGRRLYPRGNLAFLFPLLTVTSIWFLTAVRQTRYYGLVFLFGALVIYEFIRYLENRDVAKSATWYLRIAVWSAGVYLSNYLAFAGMYSALCLFVLLMQDRPLFIRWTGMTAILGVLFGAEFFAFHYDFASSWGSAPQPWEDVRWTIWDKLRMARNMHEEELFRMLPFLFLIPGVFYTLRGSTKASRSSLDALRNIPVWTAAACGVLAVMLFFAKGTETLTWVTISLTFLLAAVALWYFRALRRHEAGARRAERLFWVLPIALGAMVTFGFGVEHSSQNLPLYLCAELIVAGLLVFAVLRLRPLATREVTVLSGTALLTILVIGVSVAVTIAVGLDKGLPRYYYHVVAAGMVLAGLVSAEMLRRGKTSVGVAFLLGFLVWPNLAYRIQSSFSIVERQFALNRSIDYPVVEFFRTHAKPGERVVVFRNVQGMMLHFYLPELEWVGQLDSTNARAIHFKDRLPADAYDDAPNVDWYAVWDNYNTKPKGLDDRYEKVWDYTYQYMMPWWDAKRGAKDERRWRIYRRKNLRVDEAAQSGAPPA